MSIYIPQCSELLFNTMRLNKKTEGVSKIETPSKVKSKLNIC